MYIIPSSTKGVEIHRPKGAYRPGLFRKYISTYNCSERKWSFCHTNMGQNGLTLKKRWCFPITYRGFSLHTTWELKFRKEIETHCIAGIRSWIMVYIIVGIAKDECTIRKKINVGRLTAIVQCAAIVQTGTYKVAGIRYT